jgi:hypothetical protein
MGYRPQLPNCYPVIKGQPGLSWSKILISVNTETLGRKSRGTD